MMRLKPLWRHRSAREQRLILILLGILMIAGLGQGIWLPLQQAIESQQQRQQQLRLLSRQLQQVSAQPIGAGGLRQLLEKTAKEQAIPLQTITEQQGKMQVTLATVNADDLLRWIWQLETQGGVRVLELGLQASSSPDGRVQVKTLLVELL